MQKNEIKIISLKPSLKHDISCLYLFDIIFDVILNNKKNGFATQTTLTRLRIKLLTTIIKKANI